MTGRTNSKRYQAKSPLEEALAAYRVRVQPAQSETLIREMLEDLTRMPMEAARSVLAKSVSDLEKSLRSVDPIYLLATLATYYLIDWQSTNGITLDDGDVTQSHVEFVQALALSIPLGAHDVSSVNNRAGTAKIAELVQDVFHAHSILRLREYGELGTAQEKEQKRVLDLLRAPTQSLRNWGFPSQMRRILIELFEPLDGEFISLFGIKATSLIAVLFSLVEQVEDRLQVYLSRLRPVLPASTHEDLLLAYTASFPQAEVDVDGILAFVAQQTIKLADFKALTLEFSSYEFVSFYEFSLADIQGYVLESETIGNLKSVLDRWSLSFGDLKDVKVDHIFLNNPIWTKPFISLGDEQYFVPIVGAPVSFSMQLLESLIVEHPSLKTKYERRRAAFLEAAVANQMRRIFPIASVYTGSTWHRPVYETDGENDVLVTLDEVALILEAKSSQPSDYALRGAFSSAKTIVRKLAVEATEQGRNFADALMSWRGVHTFVTDSGSPNVVDSSDLNLILFYNISLELLTVLGVRSRTLQNVGLIPEEFVIAPMATLAELELIVDVLHDELQFLHYVQTRSRIEALDDLIADELDIFAYYLQGCPQIEKLLSSGDSGMFVYGQSKVVDIAVATQDDLLKTIWPRTKRTSLVRSLLAELKATREPGWVRAGLLLLSLSYKTQVRLEQSLQRLEQNIWKRRGGESDSQTSESERMGPRPRRFPCKFTWNVL